MTSYTDLIPAMTCDAKDRHVLAAAVRTGAAAIVTFNEADFPPTSVDPFEIDVIHPDAFLLDLLDLSPRLVIDELTQQAAANRRHPRTLNHLSCQELQSRSNPHRPRQWPDINPNMPASIVAPPETPPDEMLRR